MEEQHLITHYDYLKLDRRSTDDEIRLAYRKLSHQYHPDKNKNQKNIEQAMVLINTAYKELSNQQFRKKYDQWLISEELRLGIKFNSFSKNIKKYVENDALNEKINIVKILLERGMSEKAISSQLSHTKMKGVSGANFDWTVALVESIRTEFLTKAVVEENVESANNKSSDSSIFLKNEAKDFLANKHPPKKSKRYFPWRNGGYLLGLILLIGGYESFFDISEQQQSPAVSIGESVSLPMSGETQILTQHPRIVPVRLMAPVGASYLVKIESLYTQMTIMTIFVRASERVTVNVPLGEFKVKYVAGNEWYGYKYRFGEKSQYRQVIAPINFEYDGDKSFSEPIILNYNTRTNFQIVEISALQF